MSDDMYTVYVVMASEIKPSQMAHKMCGCYCVCDNSETAQAILDKDTEAGDIHPGGYITSHVLQTKELV